MEFLCVKFVRNDPGSVFNYSHFPPLVSKSIHPISAPKIAAFHVNNPVNSSKRVVVVVIVVAVVAVVGVSSHRSRQADKGVL